MRICNVIFSPLVIVGATLALSVGVGAQAPASPAKGAAAKAGPAKAGGAAAPAATAAVQANLAQLMRAIPFPNSNIVFDVQENDPATKAPDPKGPYIGRYQGWQGVENAGLAIAESATLMLMPGRTCQNGRPVPVTAPDFIKLAKALRTTGNEIYRAALAKNKDAVADLSDNLTDACANCHNRYRADKGSPGGEASIASRCMP